MIRLQNQVSIKWNINNHQIVFYVFRDDGVFAGLTYLRSEEVVAWHRHKLGGTFGTGSSATGYGVVESVASIAGEINEDELWVIVKRTINGNTKRYVECFSNFDFDETDPTDFKFVDSHSYYSGLTTTFWTFTFRRSNGFSSSGWIDTS